MTTAMTPEGYKLNLETITIGDIGNTKRDSEEHIQAICGEFGWDAKVKEHFMLDQKSKKIHLLLGLKNGGHMMEPVRAEQLNSTHPPQLPDIGIWRSPITTRMMLTGRIGVSKASETKEFPFLNIHTDKIAEYEAIPKKLNC